MRLLAGAGRFDQLEGGCASKGVVRCRRDVSKAELVVELGVLGGTDGGRLETREVPTEPLLDDREWLVLPEKGLRPRSSGSVTSSSNGELFGLSRGLCLVLSATNWSNI